MVPLRIGSRGSRLALAQVSLVEDYLKSIQKAYTVHIIKTSGDLIQDRPLYDIGGKALFSKEIERALLAGEIDLAVHSLKDLETPRPKGLTLCAFLPRADACDVLVTGCDFDAKHIEGCSIHDLKPGAVVGTSSPRRMAQLLAVRSDLKPVNIRGNVETRLQKLGGSSAECDAVVLAKAGLDRLGYTISSQACVPLVSMIPSAGQGIIALECRDDDAQTKTIIQGINDSSAMCAASIERGVVEELGASCRSAVGVHAQVLDDSIIVHGFVENKGVTVVKETFSLSQQPSLIIEKIREKLPRF